MPQRDGLTLSYLPLLIFVDAAPRACLRHDIHGAAAYLDADGFYARFSRMPPYTLFLRDSDYAAAADIFAYSELDTRFRWRDSIPWPFSPSR